MKYLIVFFLLSCLLPLNAQIELLSGEKNQFGIQTDYLGTKYHRQYSIKPYYSIGSNFLMKGSFTKGFRKEFNSPETNQIVKGYSIFETELEYQLKKPSDYKKIGLSAGLGYRLIQKNEIDSDHPAAINYPDILDHLSRNTQDLSLSTSLYSKFKISDELKLVPLVSLKYYDNSLFKSNPDERRGILNLTAKTTFDWKDRFYLGGSINTELNYDYYTGGSLFLGYRF